MAAENDLLCNYRFFLFFDEVLMKLYDSSGEKEGFVD